MAPIHWLKPTTLSTALVLLSACGGGGSSIEPQTEAQLSLAVSDAPVDDANRVVITVDAIELRNDDADPVLINSFVDENGDPVDSVQFDLLAYQGSDSLPIVVEQVVPVGSYNQLVLKGPFDDQSQTFVEQTDMAIKPIKVPSNELKLGQFTVAANGQPLAYTIEFELRKSMNYKPGPDEYTLKPRGVRIVQNDDVGTINGSVDNDLFWDAGDGSCELVADSEHFRRIYLYQLSDDVNAVLPEEVVPLADLYDPDLSAALPENGEVEPFAVAPLSYNEVSDNWTYEFGFVPSGIYVVAYVCDGSADDGEQFQGLTIPSIADYRSRFTFNSNGDEVCDFSGAEGTVVCSTILPD